jgi:hypothetical protein
MGWARCSAHGPAHWPAQVQQQLVRARGELDGSGSGRGRQRWRAALPPLGLGNAPGCCRCCGCRAWLRTLHTMPRICRNTSQPLPATPCTTDRRMMSTMIEAGVKKTYCGRRGQRGGLGPALLSTLVRGVASSAMPRADSASAAACPLPTPRAGSSTHQCQELVACEVHGQQAEQRDGARDIALPNGAQQRDGQRGDCGERDVASSLAAEHVGLGRHRVAPAWFDGKRSDTPPGSIEPPIEVALLQPKCACEGSARRGAGSTAACTACPAKLPAQPGRTSSSRAARGDGLNARSAPSPPTSTSHRLCSIAAIAAAGGPAIAPLPSNASHRARDPRQHASARPRARPAGDGAGLLALQQDSAQEQPLPRAKARRPPPPAEAARHGQRRRQRQRQPAGGGQRAGRPPAVLLHQPPDRLLQVRLPPDS